MKPLKPLYKILQSGKVLVGFLEVVSESQYKCILGVFSVKKIGFEYKCVRHTARIVHRRICWARPWLASRQLCLSVRALTDPSGKGRMDLHLTKRGYDKAERTFPTD